MKLRYTYLYAATAFCFICLNSPTAQAQAQPQTQAQDQAQAQPQTQTPPHLVLNFETPAWTALGIYDSWEASPFRTGALQGRAAVASNPFAQEPDPATGAPANPSPKVLAVQRSRYGSNTFGVRIDLKRPLALHPQPQYVRFLIHKPLPGRVMVMGLGKRTDRPEQSPQTEQFWAIPAQSLPGGGWTEAVASFNGSAGIEIHSLVIVPHLESPHHLQEDFVAYIDQLEVSDQRPQPKTHSPQAARQETARPDFVQVTNANRNGEVRTAQGEKLSALSVPYGQDLTVRMHPEKGFEYKGMIVKHGRKLQGPRVVEGVVQWNEVYIPRSRFDAATDSFTIPGAYIDGDVEIEGLFIELGTYKPEQEAQ